MKTYLKKADSNFIMLDEDLQEIKGVTLQGDSYATNFIKNNEVQYNAYKNYIDNSDFLESSEAEFNSKYDEVKALINLN